MARIVCQVSADVPGKQAGFTWGDGTGTFEPYRLETQCFELFWEAAQNTRRRLHDLVRDYLNGSDEAIRKSSFELALAGHELHRELFSPGEAQRHKARRVRQWLEKLQSYHGEGDGTCDFLEVVVEGLQVVPWNVVYDREPDESAFLSGDPDPGRWQPFWGLRYNLAGGRKVDPLRRMPRLRAERVLMILDPQVRAGLPAVQQRLLERFLRSHKVTAVASRDELARALKAGRADVMYWLCHATPQALVLDGAEISPNDLLRMLRAGSPDGDEQVGGLAFLNACQTADTGNAGSFLDAIHQFGLSGTVAAEQVTVDTFANRFGLAFLKRFLDRGEPAGPLLRRLRRQRSRGVPLGLLYAAYCPPDIHVPRPVAPVPAPGAPAEGPPTMRRGGALLTALEGRSEREGPLPKSPYPALASYDRKQRALFAGRDDDVMRFARLLDAPDTRVLVLHGGSGVGKSSFLLAGVIPYLEEECIGYRVLVRPDGPAGDEGRERAVLFVRATNDPAGQLARRLLDYCAGPVSYLTPTGEAVEVDLPGLLAECLGTRPLDGEQLLAALRADPTLLGKVLATLGQRLPYGPVLVIDQAEEVFTLARAPAHFQSRQLALEMLRGVIDQPGNYKVIVSLRTEYHGRLIDPLRRGLRVVNAVREYLLTDFTQQQLVEAILRPTLKERIRYASQVPALMYGFQYEAGLAEEIARQALDYCALKQDSVLPLVQVICAQLYEVVSARPDKVIRREDFGGFEGGLRKHTGEAVNRLLPNRADRAAFKKLFTRLYLRQPDGTLTTALLPQRDLAGRWKGNTSFEAIVQAAGTGDLRLLRVNSLCIEGEERSYLSLGHDALAPVAAQWDEELRRGARLRRMAAVTAGALGLAAVMTLLALVALRQKGMAEHRLNMALESADHFLIEVGGEYAQNEPGMEDTRETLLEAARMIIDNSPQESSDSRVRVRLARARKRRGDLSRQKEQRDEAEENYVAAINLLQGLMKDDPANPYYRYELADTYNWLGELRRTAPRKEDDPAGAYEDARKLQEPLVAAYPDVLSYRSDLQRTYSNVGVMFAYADKDEAARGNLDRAILLLQEGELAERLAKIRRPEDLKYQARYWQELARCHQNRAMIFDIDKACQDDQQDYKRLAHDDFATAIRLFTRITELHLDKREYRYELAVAHRNYSRLLREDCRPEEGLKHVLEARRLLEHVREDFPRLPRYREELAALFDSSLIVRSCCQSPDFQAIKGDLAQGRTLFEGLIGEFSGNPEYKYQLGMTLMDCGEVMRARDSDQAREYFREAAPHLEAAVKLKPGEGRYIRRLDRCKETIDQWPPRRDR